MRGAHHVGLEGGRADRDSCRARAAAPRDGRRSRAALRATSSATHRAASRMSPKMAVAQPSPMLRLGKEIRRRRRRAGDAGHLGAQPVQPERRASALEAGVAGEQHALARARSRVCACSRHCQIFHGALPDAQSSSSMVLSRSVSIGCQKPRCSKAISWPSRASRSIGALSQLLSSPSM